ncbi:hypothetical protein ABH991_008521 [Bradyrhizobium ottawaense]|uniref:Transposase n=1 Tax=Bradyrhizobium ottawaense TaxID=931866 RepID=A0ABV4FI16_9BRAD
MIDRGHDLSIVRQAKVLKLARSTVYYEPRPVSAEDLALMRRLDELHLDYPFAGVRVPADRDHRFQAIVITHSRAS